MHISVIVKIAICFLQFSGSYALRERHVEENANSNETNDVSIPPPAEVAEEDPSESDLAELDLAEDASIANLPEAAAETAHEPEEFVKLLLEGTLTCDNTIGYFPMAALMAYEQTNPIKYQILSKLLREQGQVHKQAMDSDALSPTLIPALQWLYCPFGIPAMAPAMNSLIFALFRDRSASLMRVMSFHERFFALLKETMDRDQLIFCLTHVVSLQKEFERQLKQGSDENRVPADSLRRKPRLTHTYKVASPSIQEISIEIDLLDVLMAKGVLQALVDLNSFDLSITTLCALNLLATVAPPILHQTFASAATSASTHPPLLLHDMGKQLEIIGLLRDANHLPPISPFHHFILFVFKKFSFHHYFDLQSPPFLFLLAQSQAVWPRDPVALLAAIQRFN
jgi:hypothetical protein